MKLGLAVAGRVHGREHVGRKPAGRLERIGGLIGFVLINAGWLGVPTTEGWKAIDQAPFGTLTFHLPGSAPTRNIGLNYSRRYFFIARPRVHAEYRAETFFPGQWSRPTPRPRGTSSRGIR